MQGYILRGKNAKTVRILVNKYASLLQKKGSLDKLINILGKENELSNEQKEAFALLSGNEKAMELAVKVNELQTKLQSGEVSPDEYEKYNSMLSNINAEIFFTLVNNKDNKSNEDFEEIENCKDQLVEAIVNALPHLGLVFDNLTDREKEDLIRNVSTEPENNFDTSSFQFIQSSKK